MHDPGLDPGPWKQPLKILLRQMLRSDYGLCTRYYCVSVQCANNCTVYVI